MSATIVTAAPVAAAAKVADAPKVETPKVVTAPAAKPAAKVAAPVKKGYVTKALTNLTMPKTAKAKAVKVGDKSVTAVRTANDGMRVDHSACTHATKGAEGKKARAACRNAIAKALAKK